MSRFLSNLSLLTVWLALVILDVSSTILGLAAGGIEGNPFGITVWTFLGFKIIVPAVLTVVCVISRNEAGLSRLLSGGLLALIGWYGFVVVNNFSIVFA